GAEPPTAAAGGGAFPLAAPPGGGWGGPPPPLPPPPGARRPRRPPHPPPPPPVVYALLGIRSRRHRRQWSHPFARHAGRRNSVVLDQCRNQGGGLLTGALETVLPLRDVVGVHH